ncbi:MAG: 30S ribosomal protein S12 methylthiotransferase RimO, partial [Candidatus Omnitrophica bacterium]|nr:30S ribosomal protein S12 methylthiotransferase RimO [Candidatus Omnitrophota bacterium]
MKKIYLLSLGCPRNMLDSEVLMGSLVNRGYILVDSPEDADIGIVNTCGFISDAKEESVEMILRLAELKRSGDIRTLIVTGCLAQRYPAELSEEIDEIDGIFGTSDFRKIPELIETIYTGKKVRRVSKTPTYIYDGTSPRKLISPRHSIYLKIQEGCSNRCSYCVIPDLKGPRRSRGIASILDEAERLNEKHQVRELVLIGQDTTSFGMDAAGKSLLPELLRRLSPLLGENWIRLLYTHPAHLTDELIDTVAEYGNICRYMDMPIQHINDDILRGMNRKVPRRRIEELIARVRRRIPGVTMRTSVIVGFPGETEREFSELMEFLENIRFERLGAFIYSREEGTSAYSMPGQVPEDEKKARFDRVMSLQQRISTGNNLKYIDERIRVL